MRAAARRSSSVYCLGAQGTNLYSHMQTCLNLQHLSYPSGRVAVMVSKDRGLKVTTIMADSTSGQASSSTCDGLVVAA